MHYMALLFGREDVPAECKRDPNWTHHIVADLAVSDSLDGFIAETNRLLAGRPLHALVNNAAISPKTPFKERLGCLNGDVQAWRELRGALGSQPDDNRMLGRVWGRQR